jgi:hypothetical protein
MPRIRNASPLACPIRRRARRTFGSIPHTSGYWVSQAIYVVAKLGIVDLLKEGSKSGEELAKATGTHAQSLSRVMRALTSVGVFTEIDGGRFGLTPLAGLLQTRRPRLNVRLGDHAEGGVVPRVG